MVRAVLTLLHIIVFVKQRAQMKSRSPFTIVMEFYSFISNNILYQGKSPCSYMQPRELTFYNFHKCSSVAFAGAC